MKKKLSDKVVSIRLPKEVFEKFKDKCDEEYKSMSEVVRSLIIQNLRKVNK